MTEDEIAQLSEEHREEIKRINERVAIVSNENVSYEDMIKEYDDWAQTYESDGLIWGYKSAIVAQREVAAIIGSNKNARILDVCSGTGKTGQFLYESGYQNLDATDGSATMLEEARKKNIYKELFQAFLGQPLDVPENSYDAITLFGGLLDGHVTPACFSCFREFVRIIKPGGYFISGIENGCVSASYRQKIEAAFQELVDEGLWELVANKIAYQENYQEQMWIYKVK